MTPDLLALSAAFTAGLVGSGHCAAMCGGIATGFPSQPGSAGWRRALEPNLGRIAGYGLAGAVAGAFGHGIVGLAQSDWVGTAARMLVGLVLVLVGLRLWDTRNHLGFLTRSGALLWQRLRPLQRHLLPAHTTARRLALGLLWGWLPCGLSSTLLAAAWLQADALDGALTMLAFGLGTLPLLVPLTWSGLRLGQHLGRGGWRLAGAALVLLSGLLTLSAPWLMQVPALHRMLGALGCVAA